MTFNPLKFSAPPTTTWSLPEAGSDDRSRWTVTPPFRLKLLEQVKVATGPFVSGVIKQLVAVTFPPIPPLAARTYPDNKAIPPTAEASNTEPPEPFKIMVGLEAMEPPAPTTSVPLLTVVEPV